MADQGVGAPSSRKEAANRGIAAALNALLERRDLSDMAYEEIGADQDSARVQLYMSRSEVDSVFTSPHSAGPAGAEAAGAASDAGGLAFDEVSEIFDKMMDDTETYLVAEAATPTDLTVKVEQVMSSTASRNLVECSLADFLVRYGVPSASE